MQDSQAGDERGPALHLISCSFLRDKIVDGISLVTDLEVNPIFVSENRVFAYGLHE